MDKTFKEQNGNVNDANVKREIWQEWSGFLSNHMSGADDHLYAVIKFVATEATIYVGGEFETVRLELPGNYKY